MSTLQLKNIPEKIKQKLKRRAKDEGLSMSDYVLQLIERDLSRLRGKRLLRKLEQLRPIESSRTAAEDIEDARREREEELGW